MDRVLKTQEKRGCYIKITLTLVGKQLGIPDVEESECLKVSGGHLITTSMSGIVCSCKYSVQYANMGCITG